MKQIFILPLLFALLPLPLQADSIEDLSAIVERHRQMLVLLVGTSDTDTDTDADASPIFAARNRYAEKRMLLERVRHRIEEQTGQTVRGQLVTGSSELLHYLTHDRQLRDGDKLAFLDLLDEVIAIESARGVPAQALQPLKAANSELAAILDDYRDEYQKALSRLQMRGSAEREQWDEYIAFLHTIYNYDELLRNSLEGEQPLYREQTRGTVAATKQKDQLKSAKPRLIWGNGLGEKRVVLTFDDGPHNYRTKKVLDILKEHQVKAYFFSVGKNMGSVARDGKVTLGNNKGVAKRIIKEGHILANHSYSHSILTKLDAAGREKELSSTDSLIKEIAGTDNVLFRPPYGSKDKALDQLALKHGLISVMWNIDSLDWADPIPESIADRVLRKLDENGSGILLFHDIHMQTVKALPDILKGLAERGYSVVTLDGSPFDKNHSGVPKLPADSAGKEKLYSNSWAVVIGINEYKHWPKLKYAANDAKSVAELLESKLGFPRDNIITLYDGEATRKRITEVLGYEMANQKKIKKDDRVFVFYAGHGMTQSLPTGNNLGYIIPVDAELTRFQTNSISMSQLDDFSAMIPAKHLYFVMDSCYSGLALTRSGLSTGQTLNYLNHVTTRRARQILTAGGADQQVADGGPGGHSVFTWTLLQAMEGLADTDNNGYVTASELGTYVAPVVASYAEQTPAFGNLVGSRGGDFVFKVDDDAVNTINAKLALETQRIEAELDAVRHSAKTNVKRRLQLQVALEKAKSGEGETPGAKTADDKKGVEVDRVKQARRLNASALQYFKSKKYKQAKAEWAEAVRLNPYNPTIVNNYGFVLDQMNENQEALKWYYRTIELDPKRITVYLNLGDIMLELGRDAEAIPYYERYLHLYPSYKQAKELRRKIEKLQQEASSNV